MMLLRLNKNRMPELLHVVGMIVFLGQESKKKQGGAGSPSSFIRQALGVSS